MEKFTKETWTLIKPSLISQVDYIKNEGDLTMKKRFLAAAVAAAITLTAGVAMAAPLQFDGDIDLHYRWNDDDTSGTSEGARATFKLNALAAIDAKTDLYARIAGQALTADNTGADFYTTKYGNSVFAFDRYGVIFKGDNTNFKVGRQGANIGATALLYSTEGKVGQYQGTLDGVSGSVKTGATNISFLAGQVKIGDGDGLVSKGDLYSVHAGYNPTKSLTVGATFANLNPDAAGDDSTNHWAVDASYGIGKANLFGEYTQSDVDTENKAFAVGAGYTFDAKNSFSVIYSKVEAAGDIAAMTDFDPNGKGLYYSYNYKFSKDTTLNVFYKDMKTVSATDDVDAGNKYNSFRTTINYKF
jgi:hypothetical protein